MSKNKSYLFLFFTIIMLLFGSVILYTKFATSVQKTEDTTEIKEVSDEDAPTHLSDLMEVSTVPNTDCIVNTDMEFVVIENSQLEDSTIPVESSPFRSIFVSINKVKETPIFDIYYQSSLGTFHRKHTVLKQSKSPYGREIFYFDGELPGLEDDINTQWNIFIFHPEGAYCTSIDL